MKVYLVTYYNLYHDHDYGHLGVYSTLHLAQGAIVGVGSRDSGDVFKVWEEAVDNGRQEPLIYRLRYGELQSYDKVKTEWVNVGGA